MSNWPVLSGAAMLGDIANRNYSSATELSEKLTATYTGWSSYLEMFAATPFACDGFELLVADDLYGSVQDNEWKVAIGAGGSEVVLAEGFSLLGMRTFFPLQLPKGVRVAISGRSTSASYRRIGMRLVAAQSMLAPRGYANMRAQAVTLATGVDIDPGATANTWSAWTDVIASTDTPTRCLQFLVRDNGTAIYASANGAIEVGIGSTPDKIGEMIYGLRYTASCYPHDMGLILANLPTGTQIVARTRSSSTDANRRVTNVLCLRYY